MAIQWMAGTTRGRRKARVLVGVRHRGEMGGMTGYSRRGVGAGSTASGPVSEELSFPSVGLEDANRWPREV